jgi:hypothetical protein
VLVRALVAVVTGARAAMGNLGLEG